VNGDELGDAGDAATRRRATRSWAAGGVDCGEMTRAISVHLIPERYVIVGAASAALKSPCGEPGRRG
jgi:hypothetical protein